MQSRLIFIRLLFLFLCHLQYASASLVITDAEKKYVDFSLTYLYDDTASLTIQEITAMEFTKSIPNQFALGYREGSAWFKITLENRSGNSDFILYFTEAIWSKFNLYEPGEDGWIEHKNGLDTPLPLRHIEDANPAFALHIATGESKTYYVHGQTIASHIGAFELYTEKEFFRPSRITVTTFYHFYSGVLFILIILNFFLLVEMRERIYTYYIGYVGTFIIWISMFSGSYLYCGFPGWDEGLHAVGTILMTFLALFSAEFLELKKYAPRMNQLFKLFSIVFVTFGVLIAVDIPYASLFFNIASSIFIILLLFQAVKTWLEGIIQTRYYLIALIIYMPTMGMMVLTFNGLLENSDFTRYAFLFGALIEIIFFSLILASKFHVAKYDQIRLQQALIEEKQKHESYLQHEIARQRQEIEEKNAIMLQQSRHAAMGEMISMIAHQWRQPLNVIALIIQKLSVLQALGKLDSESMHENSKKAEEQIELMSNTIDDFRNFFKFDHQKNRFNPAETVRHALRLTESVYKRHQILLEPHLEDEHSVENYENKLVQVLLNILKNASDVLDERNPPEKKIIISVSTTGEGDVTISVEDNAGGIPDDIAPRIFEPYFSTKSKNGTGLGLYMSKTIIEDHCHGTLSFHNTKLGACFTITLPASLESETESPENSI